VSLCGWACRATLFALQHERPAIDRKKQFAFGLSPESRRLGLNPIPTQVGANCRHKVSSYFNPVVALIGERHMSPHAVEVDQEGICSVVVHCDLVPLDSGYCTPGSRYGEEESIAGFNSLHTKTLAFGVSGEDCYQLGFIQLLCHAGIQSRCSCVSGSESVEAGVLRIDEIRRCRGFG